MTGHGNAYRLLTDLHRPADPRDGPVGADPRLGTHGDSEPADQRVPGRGAALGLRNRKLSGREPAHHRRHSRRAARGSDQRRREHDLHEVDVELRWRDAACRDFQRRHRRRPRRDAGTEPRRAGAAPAARGSARARRHDRQGLVDADDGRAPRFAEQDLRRAVPVQFRQSPRSRRARAPAGRRPGSRLRHRQLCDARLDRPGARRHARPLGERHRQRDPRAERPGFGRQHRQPADAGRLGAADLGQCPGATRIAGGFRRDRAEGRRRPAHTAQGRCPRRARRQQLCDPLVAQQRGRCRDRDIRGAGRQHDRAVRRDPQADVGARGQLP